MRRVKALATSLILPLCGSCCGTAAYTWTVSGRLLNMDGGALDGEVTSFRLLRNGVDIEEGFQGFFEVTPLKLDSDGAFEVVAVVGLGDSCGLTHTPLGGPPDMIEMDVWTGAGSEIEIVVPVLEASIVESTEIEGLQASGVIELGQIEVPEEGNV